MAVKAMLAKLEEVPEGLRAHYKQRGDKFVLDVEGLEEHPELSNLRSAKQHEKDDRVAAEAKAKDLQKRIDELEAEMGERLKGKVSADEVARLEKLHADKVKTLQTEIDGLKSTIGKRDEIIRDVKVEAVALQLATEMAVTPEAAEVFMPHIRKRLAVNYDGDKAETVVLDEAGKPTDMKPEQLKAIFVEKPAFANIIKASSASGSGATGGSGSGGADTGNRNDDTAAMNPAVLAARIKAKKAQARK